MPSASVAAEDLAALDGAAADHDGPAARPVIAAGVLVDARRAAEFTHPHDDGVLPQATIDQVLDQSTHGIVQGRLQACGVGLEVLGVGVPAAQVDFDRGDAGFDQAASHQSGLAEIVVAIGIHQGCGFVSEIEDLAFLGSD